MQTLSGLVIWDLALFGVVLAAGLLLWLAGPRRKAVRPPLRRIFGRRMAAASLLFAVAAPLDGWKTGAGVILAVAGMAGVLSWCLVTVCRNLDGEDSPKK